MREYSKKERNDSYRKSIDEISKNYGIKLIFIASSLNMSISSFSHWKNNKYDFGEDRLDSVKSLINQFTQNI